MPNNTDDQFASWDDDQGFPWDDDETQPDEEELNRERKYEDELLKRYGINLNQYWS